MKRLVTIFLLLMFSISFSGELVFAKISSQHLYKSDSVKRNFTVADNNLNIERVKKPLFALKTNLLFDLATLLNFEIEVPIKNRFSIAGEFIFPFWKSNSADFTLEMLNANIDIKYWFGNRDNIEVMTGWNVGIYGGCGKFDYQFFSKNGVQGNFFNVGIGAGYAHSIAKNLRLEYSLGLGLIRSDYYKYRIVKDNNYGYIKVVTSPWNKFYNNFLGPTKAKISLVWLINYRSSK